MENDYRITKLHGTFIGDNRIPDLPAGETAKILSSTNGKTEWVDLPEGGKELELIEVSNATINPDGSYTYTLPNKPTSNPYILKTVDNGDASYYLMTGDSDVSFGMRPIALTDSLFGGNFMLVSGTTATQRPTNFPPQPKSADNGKVLTVKDGYPSWETAGGASVSPCLNLMDMSGEPTVRTSITEEEKNNLDKGLYNSVYYYDASWGESAEISITLPQLLTNVSSTTYMATIYTGSISEDSGSISGLLEYRISIGEKNTDGTYPLTIEKTIEIPFAGGGGGTVEVITATKTSNPEFEEIGFTAIKLDKVPVSSQFILSYDNESLLMYKNADGLYTGASFASLYSAGLSYALVNVDSSGNAIGAFRKYDLSFLNDMKRENEGKVLTIESTGHAFFEMPPRYEHTVTIKTSAGKILWTQTMRNSSNTVVNSYANLKTLFGGATYAGFGEYCQLNLRGGTEETDKLIKLDGTEATLASLGAIVYTDVCFLPK